MTTQKACKLCLKASNDFQVIDKITRELLDVLQLKIDFSLNEKYVICESCTDSIYTYFEFKSMCLHSKDGVAPFIRSVNGMEVDIVKVAYLKENSGGISSSDDALCQLCLKRDRCVDLNALNESFGEDITSKCIPEIDINFTKDPKICLSCQTTLVNFCQFVTKCSVKQENLMECDDRETCLAIKSEELDIKTEVEECDGNTSHSLPIPLSSAIPSEDTKMKSFLDKSYNQETNHMSINSDSNQNCDEKKMEYPEGHKLLEDVAVTCSHYPYVTKQKGDLSKQVLIHQKSLKRMLIHKDAEITTYDCSFCTFKTKLKRSLTRHMLIHKDASEVTTYQCTLCPYKSKRKYYLTRHMLIHKDTPEITTYDCSFCSYKTKQKSHLTRHMLIHMDASQIKTYDCSFCNFKTKHKISLTMHMLSHKDASEVTTYQCTLCPYKSKRKYYLTRHMLIHKDTSEITTYNCSFCTFKTKQKRSLATHMLVHKNASEVTTYDCSLCPYKAKQKRYLTRHMLIHKDISEVTPYDCSFCSFKTKQKKSLTRHTLIHKDASEVMAYQCALCPYKTKRKDDLSKHMRNHKSAS